MEIVGKVIANAVVKQLKDDREVVSFSVVVNDYYKPKGEDKNKQVALFINCSYWLTPTIAERITKGAVVEMNGRLSLNAYKDMDGDAKASLNAHINTIKIHHSNTKGSKADTSPPFTNELLDAVKDDLPF